MKEPRKKWIRSALFTLGGALVGLAYYMLVNCTDATCSIAANPIRCMIYVGLIGLFVSIAFGKDGNIKCNM